MRWVCISLIFFATGCAVNREVVVSARPADATISVDGVSRGKGPITEDFSFASETEAHSVMASRQGFRDEVVRVARDFDRGTLLIELKPRTHRVTINVAPVPGVVSIDGKAISPDPVTQVTTDLEYTLDAHSQFITHTVTAERPGYNKAEQRLIWSDAATDYTLTLGVMRKDLAITTTPPGAQVYINDQLLGPSPVMYSGFAFPVNPDNNQWLAQKMKVVRAGYDPVETPISWDDGKTDYHVDLKPHEKTVRFITNPPGAAIKLDGADLKPDAAGQVSAHLVFAPLDDKGTLRTYAGVATRKTADAEWEPLPFTVRWDEGKSDYALTLKEIMIRPVALLRPKFVHSDDGWQVVPERLTTLCNKDPGEPADGPKPTRLTDLPKGTMIDSLTVSPDGSQLLFTSLISKSEKDLRSTMSSVKTDGSAGATSFGDDKSLDLYPCYTPDGSQIVFATNRGGRRLSIWEMAAAGDPGITQLTSGEETDLWPTIDSDPKPRLYYQSLIDSRTDARLFVTTLGANSRTDLTRAGGMQPRVSPRGDNILFTALNEKTGKRQIYRMPDHGGVPALLTAADADEFDPAWSPDGTRVAFVSDRGVDADNRSNFDLYVVELGHVDKPTRLTRNGSWDDSPVWDPSGQAIYFRSNRGGDWGIWKIPVK